MNEPELRVFGRPSGGNVYIGTLCPATENPEEPPFLAGSLAGSSGFRSRAAREPFDRLLPFGRFPRACGRPSRPHRLQLDSRAVGTHAELDRPDRVSPGILRAVTARADVGQVDRPAGRFRDHRPAAARGVEALGKNALDQEVDVLLIAPRRRVGRVAPKQSELPVANGCVPANPTSQVDDCPQGRLRWPEEAAHGEGEGEGAEAIKTWMRPRTCRKRES